LEKRLNEGGFATFRFNYRTSPFSGRFEETTLTSRVEDLRAAIDFLSGREVNDIGIIGSSFGGIVAIAGGDRARAMVLLATPLKLEFPVKDGRIELESGRWLKPEFLEDLKRYDLREKIRSICPVLIVHGSDDEIVPLDDACEIYKCADAPKRLEILDGGDHTFSRKDHLEKIAELSLDWFNQYLTASSPW
jgi:fermentation-respiration switch protein FrsA (DUF1100 family)